LKIGVAIAGLLVSGIAASLAPKTSDAADFDYYYIVANEGGSSGGHTAIRFGEDVYHFQSEGGLLVLHRDRADEFLYSYTLLDNRTIYSTRIDVSDDTYSRVVEKFRLRHRAGEAQANVERSLRRDRELLAFLRERAIDPGRSSSRELNSVRGLGYFASIDSRDSRDSGAQTRPASLALLRRDILHLYGDDFIEHRRRRIECDLRDLLREDPTAWSVGDPASVYDYPPFARSFFDRWADLRAGLAALDVLDSPRPLNGKFYHAPAEEAFVLDDDERSALARYAKKLNAELVGLLKSKRADWGQTLLVGMARLIALNRSIESGRLVFLDTYPETPGDLLFGVVERSDDLWPMMVAENKEQLDASRAELRNASDPGELVWERVEERSNRYLEMLRSRGSDGKVRVAQGHLVPSRSAPYSVSDTDSNNATAATKQLAAASNRHRVYADALRRLHGYNIVTQNCSTAIFETINDAFDDSRTIVHEQLGGYVDSRNSLAFVPFISANQVNDRYRISGRESYSSYRRLRLREMKERELPALVAVRESNTFTAESYRRNANDSFFVFFTDDTVLLRPLLGTVNLAAAVGQSAVGVVVAPVDRSATLLRGLRGAFVSLPELVFANIRKGSNEWVPRDYRSFARGFAGD
jgi:hypothetical protein